jgi:tol-pal system protein YbgF
MTRRFVLPVLLLALGAHATPAAAGPDKEYLQLLAEIRMLQEQNQQLQQLFGSLQDALKAVSTKLDDQANADRKAMADQTLAINNIGDTVRVLREKADDTNVRIATVSQEIQALRQAIASMPQPQAIVTPAQLPPGGDPGAAAPPTTPPPPVTTPVVPPGASPQRMFETAFDDFSAGRYDTAIEGFRLFIQAFPRLPQAAQAQFNIGASYFNQSQWTEARDAFLAVTTNYPQDADTNAQAYFKLGATYEMLKQLDRAKSAYETVVQKYPASFQATQAAQALQRIDRLEGNVVVGEIGDGLAHRLVIAP